MRGLLGAVLVAGLAAATAPALDAVTYKEYAYKVGDKTRTTKTEETVSVTTVTANGNTQKKDEKKKKTLVYTTRVVHVGSDPTKPEKVVRTYEKAVEVKDGAEAPLPLDGLSVSIERTDGGYTFLRDDGTKLPAKAATDLDNEFNKKGDFGDAGLFPKTPIKPGDTWNPTEKFLEAVNTPENPFGIDPAKAKVTAKLLSTAKTGGATTGEVVMTADLALVELRGKQPIKLNPGSRWTIEMKGNGALDGTSPEGTMTGVMKIQIDGTLPGAALKVEADVKQSSRTVRVR